MDKATRILTITNFKTFLKGCLLRRMYLHTENALHRSHNLVIK
jgi:hypothetical protein